MTLYIPEANGTGVAILQPKESHIYTCKQIFVVILSHSCKVTHFVRYPQYVLIFISKLIPFCLLFVLDYCYCFVYIQLSFVTFNIWLFTIDCLSRPSTLLIQILQYMGQCRSHYIACIVIVGILVLCCIFYALL